MLRLSIHDARRLLAAHHFTPGDARSVLRRLGSVQFDPLNPVGRNHDLVLQARVPDYKVGDWEKLAYGERFLYDAWDKQASLVLMEDWPVRRIYHRWHRRHWPEVFEAHPEAVTVVREELARRGPLTSSAFEYQVHKDEWRGSWYGAGLTKRVLRALWHTGEVVTHSRRNGHHVYDLAERVIPAELRRAAPVPEEESVEWLIKLRHRATGLLRPGAGAYLWSLDIPVAERRRVVARLVERGELVSVEVEGMRLHALPEVLAGLESSSPDDRMVFVAPLDQLIWDRRAALHLFDFDYLWEVYVPEAKRRWGYYVLPVFYGGRFVARFDSRLRGKVWEVYRWLWEGGVSPDAAMLAALREAAERFVDYLGAETVTLPNGLDEATRAALKIR